MKKEKIIMWWIALAVFILVLCLYIPLWIKNHKIRMLQKEIQKVEAQIEYNKEQRLNCETNMKLWNDENNANRELVAQLKEQYNSMVGFTQAWQ